MQLGLEGRVHIVFLARPVLSQECQGLDGVIFTPLCWGLLFLGRVVMVFFISVLLVCTATPVLEDPLNLSACPVRSSSREPSGGLMENHGFRETSLRLSCIVTVPTASLSLRSSSPCRCGAGTQAGEAPHTAEGRAAGRTQSLPAGPAASLDLKTY